MKYLIMVCVLLMTLCGGQGECRQRLEIDASNLTILFEPGAKLDMGIYDRTPCRERFGRLYAEKREIDGKTRTVLCFSGTADAQAQAFFDAVALGTDNDAYSDAPVVGRLSVGAGGLWFTGDPQAAGRLFYDAVVLGTVTYQRNRELKGYGKTDRPGDVLMIGAFGVYRLNSY